MTGFLSLLFPPRCPFCGGDMRAKDVLCEGCRRKIGKVSRTYTLKGGEKLSVLSPLRYEGDFKAAMHRYKFGGKRELAKTFSSLMAEIAPEGPFDFIAFVPLRSKDLRARGFDQSELLAKELGKLLKLPLYPCLRKIRETAVQHTLSREERRKNLIGAFSADDSVKGKTVLLVDDIVTTGSTLCAAAEALYKSGAKEVACLCALAD